jgi:hypothetical protein
MMMRCNNEMGLSARFFLQEEGQRRHSATQQKCEAAELAIPGYSTKPRRDD